jgi:hypothetical protein
MPTTTLVPKPVTGDPVIEAPHVWTIDIETDAYRFALDQWTDFSISWNHDGATVEVEVNVVDPMIGYIRELVTDLVFKRDTLRLFRFRVLSSEDTMTRDAAIVKFTCATYESILARRVLYEDWVLEDEDVDAAWALIQYTQAQPYGNLGITRATPPVGVVRQRSLAIGTTIRDAIDDFATTDNGFDWWIDVDRVFHIAKPRRGFLITDNQWATGAEVAELTRTNPTEQYASDIIAVGARNETRIPNGSGGDDVYPPPTPQRVSLPVMPFGLWDTAMSYSDVITVASLAEKANYELRDRANMRPVYKLTLEPGIWNPSIGLGDVITFRILFPPRADVRVPIRIEEMEIGCTTDGSETVSLSARAEEPETFISGGPLGPIPVSPLDPVDGRTTQATRLRPWDDLAAILAGVTERIGIQERQLPVGVVPPPTSLGFRFVQATPATTWTITHNLGFYPNATVIATGGSQAEGDPTYTDVNHMTITFSAALSGTCYLS